MPHRLAHARAYPFDAPDECYVLTQLGPTPMHEEAWEALEYLTPVIASGSNRSPDRLAQKFQGMNHAPIPVTRAVVHGLDSVYSAHIATYGALPATLHPAPGVVSDLAITWLDETTLERMHDTESLGQNYDFVELTDVRATLKNETVVENAHAYISRRGAFAPDGTPIALAAMTARGRTFPEMHQADVMTRAHAHLGIAETIEDFFLSLIEDADRRLHISDALEQVGMAFTETQAEAEAV